MAAVNAIQSTREYTHKTKGIIVSDKREIEWVTVVEAAEIMNMHVESVRRMCRKNAPDFRCRQLFKGAAWEVVREDAENHVKQTHKNE